MATRTKTSKALQPRGDEKALSPPTHHQGPSSSQRSADLVTEGLAANAMTADRYTPEFGSIPLCDLVSSMRRGGRAVNAGDLSSLERMLTGQAVALNAMFGELARRSALNMGEHMGAMETYLKLALKAQSQSRATVETLAAIKSPPVLFAKQANINNGGNQQVNNGAAATSPRAEEKQIHSHELLEASHGERMDFGAQSQAGGIDPQMETVGAIHWPEKL